MRRSCARADAIALRSLFADSSDNPVINSLVDQDATRDNIASSMDALKDVL